MTLAASLPHQMIKQQDLTDRPPPIPPNQFPQNTCVKPAFALMLSTLVFDTSKQA